MDRILDLQDEKLQFLIDFADFFEIWSSSSISECIYEYQRKELMIQ